MLWAAGGVAIGVFADVLSWLVTGCYLRRMCEVLIKAEV